MNAKDFRKSHPQKLGGIDENDFAFHLACLRFQFVV